MSRSTLVVDRLRVRPSTADARRATCASVQYACPEGDMLACYGAEMEQRQLGLTGPRVSAVGLGCMSLGIGDIYSSSLSDDGGAVALIRRALDLGSTFLDSADIYGDSELKVGKAVAGRRGNVVLATKFGFVQGAIGQAEQLNGRPEYVHEACERSLRRLDTDYIERWAADWQVTDRWEQARASR